RAEVIGSGSFGLALATRVYVLMHPARPSTQWRKSRSSRQPSACLNASFTDALDNGVDIAVHDLGSSLERLLIAAAKAGKARAHPFCPDRPGQRSNNRAPERCAVRRSRSWTAASPASPPERLVAAIPAALASCRARRFQDRGQPHSAIRSRIGAVA